LYRPNQLTNTPTTQWVFCLLSPRFFFSRTSNKNRKIYSLHSWYTYDRLSYMRRAKFRYWLYRSATATAYK